MLVIVMDKHLRQLKRKKKRKGNAVIMKQREYKLYTKQNKWLNETKSYQITDFGIKKIEFNQN